MSPEDYQKIESRLRCKESRQKRVYYTLNNGEQHYVIYVTNRDETQVRFVLESPWYDIPDGKAAEEFALDTRRAMLIRVWPDRSDIHMKEGVLRNERFG